MIWSGPVINPLTSVMQISALLWQCSFRGQMFFRVLQALPLEGERETTTRRSAGLILFLFLFAESVCVFSLLSSILPSLNRRLDLKNRGLPTCRRCRVVKKEPVFRSPSLSPVPFALFVFFNAVLWRRARSFILAFAASDVDVFLPFSPFVSKRMQRC